LTMTAEIPLRNIWLLMLYASDLYHLPQIRKTGVEDNPEDLPDLIAELLCDSVEGRLRMNLTASYRDQNRTLTRVRGRVMLLETERKRLLDKGTIACRFEELTIDTPRNRFVLAAMEKCLRRVSSRELAGRCRKNIGALRTQGVSGKGVLKSDVTLNQFTRNDAHDRIMVAASRFAHDMLIPNESAGNFQVNEPGREERWLRSLFEKAVGGFYRVSATPLGWKVTPGKWLNWDIEERSDRIDELLPKMKTDIYLEHVGQSRRIIIDTKFTNILKAGHYREKSIRSGYMYQIYAYIQSQKTGQANMECNSEGILLHPAVGLDLDESVRIQGSNYRFATVDLSQDTNSIRDRLNSFL
jgi:5-methylcytosine-specific restriction enzyme subunit McrC